MNTYSNFSDDGVLRFERILPGPAERVWSWLTEPDKRARWLAGGAMDLKEGGEMELIWHNSRLSKDPDRVPEKYQQYEGFRVTGEIIDCEPPRLLRFLLHEDFGQKSEVTFKLVPRDDGTVKLVLTHRKLGDDRDMIVSVASGWHSHLDILSDRLHNRDIPDFWELHARLEKEYKERIS